jgi:plastocyanin
MRRTVGATALGTVAAAIALTGAARAEDPAPATAPIDVGANGDTFFGGLSFTPASVTAAAGQVIRWTNTNRFAPHTVTEAHGLFDLVGAGTGATRTTPGGFGPKTSVELAVPAGTIEYYCRVHPGKMNGELKVPVTLALGPPYVEPKTKAKTKLGRARRAARKRAFQRKLTLTWAAVAPPDGQVFDVQVRRGSGPWKTLLTRTIDTTITINSGKHGTTSSVRSRLRMETDMTQATGWSPVSTVAP